MPWLRLKKPCRIGGVDFLPWKSDDDAVVPDLSDCSEVLSTILSGYLDRTGKPIDNCVVAMIGGSGWNLADSDFQTVRWAASLLFLTIWASNEYYPHFGGPYVNSSAFRVVWQRFTGKPDWIALRSRRRDGGNLDGGYKHGEVTSTLPLQCTLRDTAVVDEALRAALESANTSGSDTMKRLRFALPFVELANTDDDLVTGESEAILMSSAFEQLLHGKASAYKLAKKFGALFTVFGKVTVDEGRSSRPGIEVDQTSTDRTAAAQLKWWLHQKWIEELYDVRSKSVHEGTAKGRTWGWSIGEHLVMAAWVFPLAVKLLLQRDTLYALTDLDKGRCYSVDTLLSKTGWADSPDAESTWQRILSEAKERVIWDRLKDELRKSHRQLFDRDQLT